VHQVTKYMLKRCFC